MLAYAQASRRDDQGFGGGPVGVSTLAAVLLPLVLAGAGILVSFATPFVSNATRIGVFSLFYSIPGTYWHRMLAQRQGPVLIERLSKLSYDMQVFRSAPLYSPEFDRTVFSQVRPVRTFSQGKSPAARDRDLTDDFIRYLDTRSKAAPFFPAS